MSDEERTASMTVAFQPHNGTWRPSSGSVEMNGVPAGAALDSFLNAMEESLTYELEGIPQVAMLLSGYDFDGELVPLEDRTRRLMLKLLAHQVLLSRVASRAYQQSSVSIATSLPRD